MHISNRRCPCCTSSLSEARDSLTVQIVFVSNVSMDFVQITDSAFGCRSLLQSPFSLLPSLCSGPRDFHRDGTESGGSEICSSWSSRIPQASVSSPLLSHSSAPLMLPPLIAYAETAGTSSTSFPSLSSPLFDTIPRRTTKLGLCVQHSSSPSVFIPLHYNGRSEGLVKTKV